MKEREEYVSEEVEEVKSDDITEQDKLDELAVKYRKLREYSLSKEAEWRAEAEKDEDYYYGDQLSEEERKAYKQRNRADIEVNEIAPLVDRLLGEEEVTNFDWKAAPVESSDINQSRASSSFLRTIGRTGGYQYAFSDTAQDAIVTGRGFINIYVDKKMNDSDIKIYYRNVPWYESCLEPYITDYDTAAYANYFFWWRWYPVATAIEMFPEAEETIKDAIGTDDMMASGDITDVNDESMDIDRKNHKVKITECWYRENGKVYTLHFIGNKGLKHCRAKIYEKESGEYEEKEYFSFIPFIQYSVKYQRRKNKWQGLVRTLRGSQDEINHRHMKAVFSLDSRGVIYEEGAISKEMELKVLSEISKPNFAIKVKNGAKKFEIVENTSMTEQQYKIMLSAENRIRRLSGANNEYMGYESNAESGSAMQERKAEAKKIQGKIFGNARRTCILMGQYTLEVAEAVFTDKQKVRILGKGHGEYLDMEVDPKEISKDIVVSQVPMTADYRLQQAQTMKDLAANLGIKQLPFSMIKDFYDWENPEEVEADFNNILKMQEQPTPEQQMSMQKLMADIELQKAQIQSELASAEKDRAAVAKIAEETQLVHANMMTAVAELRQLTQQVQQEGAKNAAIVKALSNPNTQYQVESPE